MLKIVIISCLLIKGSGEFKPPDGFTIASVEQRGTDCSHLTKCEDNGMCTHLTVMCQPSEFTTRVILESDPSYDNEIAIPKGCTNPSIIDIKGAEDEDD